MTRLQAELRRLYLPAQDEALIDGRGLLRGLVLELARPGDWAVLSAVWRGVQADLGLPAPAIAVSGTDGLRLWFSLAQPVGLGEAHAFLSLLCRRYLPEVPATRLRLMPAGPAAAGALDQLWPPVRELPEGRWSAFVAQDLAPLFSETPWIDFPPTEDGQAKLLAGLRSIPPALFAEALRQLSTVDQPVATPPADARLPAVASHGDPKAFLLGVMNDEAVPLALRIEAAKALLAHGPAA
jgi:hypothetical protein